MIAKLCKFPANEPYQEGGWILYDKITKVEYSALFKCQYNSIRDCYEYTEAFVSCEHRQITFNAIMVPQESHNSVPFWARLITLKREPLYKGEDRFIVYLCATDMYITNDNGKTIEVISIP